MQADDLDQPVIVGSGVCDKHEKDQIFCILFLPFLGLFFLPNEGYGQFSQTSFIAQEKADSVVLFFYSGHLHSFAEADSFMELQFRLENEPDIITDSFKSSPLNQGHPGQQIIGGGFWIYDTSGYFTSVSVNGIGEFQNQSR